MSQPKYRLLREIAEILKGKETVLSPSAHKEASLLFNPVNIQDGQIKTTENSVYVQEQENGIKLRERDLIFFRNGDQFGIYFVREDDPRCCLAAPYILIRSTYSNYLDIFFKSELGKKLLQSRFSIKNSADGALSDIAILRNIKIPMLNEEILSQLQSKTIQKFSEEDVAKVKDAVTKYASAAAVAGAAGAAASGLGVGLAGVGSAASLGALIPVAGAIVGGLGLFGLMKKNKKQQAMAAENINLNHSQIKADTADQTVAAEKVFDQVEKEMKQFLETGQLEKSPTEEQFRWQELYMLKEIYNLIKKVDKKIDLVLESLELLQNDLKDIRETDRSIEEKIQLISYKVDQRLKTINETLSDDIQAYKAVLKQIITDWDDLHPLSQEFLPLAEYLYDKLGKIENADFSPVILQYCRSLENELLQKLFVGFCLHLYEKEKNLKVFLEEDFKNDKTKKFAQPIYEKRNKPKESIQFTLGVMRLILVFAKRDDVVESSPLLREFRYFIKHSFREQFILTDEYIKQLQKIVDDYRNKCAHPYKLGKEKASQCRELVPQCLNKLLEGFD